MSTRHQVNSILGAMCFILGGLLGAGQAQGQYTGSIRSSWNSWNYVLVQVQGFPSDLQTAATQALSGAANQWNSQCGSSGGVGGLPELITSPPVDSTYFTRFTIQYINGIHPDPTQFNVCGSFDSGSLANIYTTMRTGTGANDLAPCQLSDPAKLQHMMAHEIGHRFGLSDSGCNDHAMSRIPSGADSSTVQSSECARAESLNNTAAERNVCDQPTECRQSPILINCRRNPWELSSLSGGVWFDYDGDGHLARTAWTIGRSNIGFLFTDLDGTGCAETGGELFGDHRRIGEGDLASNGFEALATYDSDFDGRITPSDLDWIHLRVWIDSSHDGECSPGETFTLPEARMMAIDLAYTSSDLEDEHGNQFRFLSTGWCRTQSGRLEERTVYDIFFLTNGQD